MKQVFIPKISLRLMKRLQKPGFFFLIFLLNIFSAKAQYSLPLINQYYTNPYILNPAQAGGYDFPVIYITYKNQWNGVNGGPVTSSVTANTPFLKSSGIGINVYNDSYGLLDETKAVVSFSQTVFIDAEKHYISFGLSGGVINEHISLSRVVGETGKPLDPVAASYNNSNPFLPDLDFGLAYRYHRLTANFVVPDLIKFSSLTKRVNFRYEDLPLYFTSVAYEFPLGESFSFTPMVSAHAIQGVSNQFDISGLITFSEEVSLGIFYHNNQSFTVSIGYLAGKSLDINYAFTQSSAAIQQYFGNTNEISIGYHFSSGHESRSSKNRLIRCPKLAD